MRSPLTEERKKLCVKYMPLARALAKPFKVNWPNEAHEFESAAMYALVQAAENWKVEYNVKFQWFARKRIFGELRTVQRQFVLKGFDGCRDNMPKVISFTNPCENNGRVLFATKDPYIGCEMEQKDFMERESRRLPAAHREVFKLLHIEEVTQDEASKRLGVSKSMISAMNTYALNELKYLSRNAC